MATVYLARDLRHGRPVAIKVLRPEIAAALGPERFLWEIELAARLTHLHILALHDSGQAGGFLYYVMPYIEGNRCGPGWRGLRASTNADPRLKYPRVPSQQRMGVSRANRGLQVRRPHLSPLVVAFYGTLCRTACRTIRKLPKDPEAA